MELHCKGETNIYIIYKEHTIRNTQKKYLVIWSTKIWKKLVVFIYLVIGYFVYMFHHNILFYNKISK